MGDTKMTGAEIIIACLKEQGVRCVFGYPGASILHVYDALYRLGGILHYRTAHEQGAAHAADGYARATGEVGVCLATSGPGATNLITGIAAAYMDSSPVVCITCNVNSRLIARDAFQEADITGITIPITKNNYMVSDIRVLADTLREAFAVATSGRRGPVLVDITSDVTCAEAVYTSAAPIPECAKTSCDMTAAARLLNESVRPAMLLGGGVVASDARDAALAVATRLGAPVAATMMGLSAGLSDYHGFLGMAGVQGTADARRALCEADVILAAGTRFSDRLTDALKTRAKLIHIDIDAAELSKNIDATLGIVCDARIALTELEPLLNPLRVAWFVRKNAPKTSPILEALSRDVTVTTDVGLHQILAANGIKFKKSRSFITSGGFGAMGFGLGAAIGAAAANPDKPVIHITGDGSFRMNLIELATVAEYGFPIITVIFDNSALGMVMQWQDKLFGGRRMESVLPPTVDYLKIAEGYGITTYAPHSVRETQNAITAALASGKPAVILQKNKQMRCL